MIKAVIFDMDGVITRTEDIHALTFDMVLKEYGAVRSEELKKKVTGMPGKAEWELYKKTFPKIKDNVDTLKKKREKYYTEKAKKIPLFPGFRELFFKIKELKLKVSLTTSSNMFYINLGIPKEIRESFDVITTSDDVVNGKPDPEPYLRSVKLLGLKAEECVVFEDSLNGIRSALDAGCYCVAVTNSFTREEIQELKPTMIIDSLEEINLEKIKAIGDE